MDPNITVTIAGLPRWPLSGAIPDGVNFLGQLPLAEVASLYDCHDLLVMPTRVEGFGFVFLEALSRGLPCIGRDDFAMPEMIRPGLNGALLSKDDPEEARPPHRRRTGGRRPLRGMPLAHPRRRFLVFVGARRAADRWRDLDRSWQIGGS